MRIYNVEIHTDEETGQICVELPTLNNVADFGETVEEALENLKKLADFAIECTQEDGEEIPESDEIEAGKTYLSFEIGETIEQISQMEMIEAVAR